MEPVRSTGITRIMTVTGIPILACCPQCCCSSPIVCWPVIICRHPPPVYSRAAVHHLLLLAGAARHPSCDAEDFGGGRVVSSGLIVGERASGVFAVSHELLSDTFAASLTLTSLGLWLWLGADTSRRPLRPSDRWQAGDAKPLSLPRLALGALCIAANFGCRPTFTLAALLAFPLFWPQIRALGTGLRTRRIKPLQALRARWR